jgi:3-phenylpropionate/trans-cinnamate dioxygenase ferredoxin reductase component
MAGANEQLDYIPYFFSDLFEFGYESAGEISSALTTHAAWKERNRTGIIYYMAGDKVRGVMLCNVWDKIDEAKKIVRSKRNYSPKELDSAIQF